MVENESPVIVNEEGINSGIKLRLSDKEYIISLPKDKDLYYIKEGGWGMPTKIEKLNVKTSAKAKSGFDLSKLKDIIG